MKSVETFQIKSVFEISQVVVTNVLMLWHVDHFFLTRCCPEYSSKNLKFGLFCCLFRSENGKEQGQRVENLKAIEGNKLVQLLEGEDHILSRTDELPGTVIMKHINAFWRIMLLTSF